MGLLDQLSNLSPEQTQGLLAAASQFLQAGGPSRMPTSFGQALGGGIQGYQQGSAAYRKQKQDEEDAAQAAQFNGLKIQGLTGELADKETGRQQQLAAQKWLLNYNAQQNNPTTAAQSILGSNLAPTQENAALLKAQPAAAPSPQQSIYDRQLAQAQAMRNSGNPQLIAQADMLEKSALAARPKYSTDFRTAMGPDGKLHNYVLNDNGEFKDTGLAVAPKIRELNLGGTTQLIDDNSTTPGKVFKRTMTPDSAASNALARERLQFDKTQADEASVAPQYMDTLQGLMALPKRLKAGQSPTGQLVAGPDGKPLEKKQNIPQYVVEGITGNAKSLASIDAALASLKTPEGKNAVGWKGYLPNSVLNRSDPEGTSTRANISDVGSLILHDRSGASVTAAESPRLMPFIPLTTDDDVTAAKKLKRFRELIQAETNNFTFQYPGAKALADFSSGNQGASGDTPLRKYNPATGKIE